MKALHTFTATFPERIRAVYIQGSYADNSNVNTSDMDLLIVFKDRFQQEEHQQAELVVKQCIAETPYQDDDVCKLMKAH